jgi:predicted ATP-binding protein involved in virulence
MRVISLLLENFRGFEKLDLQFPDEPPLMVFLGVNGAGKSSILDAISGQLEYAVVNLSPGGGRMPWIGRDMRQGAERMSLGVALRSLGQDLSLSFTSQSSVLTGILEPTHIPKRDDVSGDNRHGSAVSSLLSSDPTADVPIAVHYRATRHVIRTPLEHEDASLQDLDFPQRAAFLGALDGNADDFGDFFRWYRDREDIENEQRRRPGQAELLDRQLEAVRQAVRDLFPGVADLAVRRSRPEGFTLTKLGTPLVVEQLSDGEKCLLALAGDLARRLAIANPSRENPCEGEGVVLIDEIELHFHPQWQRRIIPDLRRAFPNIQFIVTTQSPQVVSQVPAECVRILRPSEGGIEVVCPEHSEGLDSNTILEVLMETPERPQDVRDRLSAISRDIDDARYDDASGKLAAFRAKYGNQPHAVRLETLIGIRKQLGGGHEVHQ